MNTNVTIPKSDGGLWVNNEKQGNQPDHRGKLVVTIDQINKLIEMANMGMEPILQLGCWHRVAKETGVPYMYLNSEVYIKPPQQQQPQGYAPPPPQPQQGWQPPQQQHPSMPQAPVQQQAPVPQPVPQPQQPPQQQWQPPAAVPQQQPATQPDWNDDDIPF